ncbi:hypothetical protein TRVL_08561 [Trypanosoma vivax]|nr:hypothetical protein TRVL_08561 [Trypanosoma vivax]
MRCGCTCGRPWKCLRGILSLFSLALPPSVHLRNRGEFVEAQVPVVVPLVAYSFRSLQSLLCRPGALFATWLRPLKCCKFSGVFFLVRVCMTYLRVIHRNVCTQRSVRRMMCYTGELAPEVSTCWRALYPTRRAY